ncbi:MAG TPA: S8 family serine peptidase [Candidatus Lokiarchaeia archaeon]|nr:S8 family serine peptidase [Candidatus Lokiarchaeia archaeon]
MDPALGKELNASDGNAMIETWFLFQNSAAETQWLSHHAVSNYKSYDLDTGIYLTDTVSHIKQYLKDDDGNCIKSAWLERKISTNMTLSGRQAMESLSPSQPGANNNLNITEFRKEKNLDGRGIIVGILSTGIGIHKDLTWVYNKTGGNAVSKIIANVSFVDWDPLFVDVNGAGTYLAGVIAGTGNDSKGQYKGVAPGAQLINAKCVDFSGITLWHWAVSAIEFCFTHGADIIVAGWNIIGYPGDPLTTAVDAVTKLGVTVVSAAGDLGPSFMTIETPGMASSSICVGGADTTTGTITPANFSSRGPSIELVSKPDLLAPAINITSCLPDLNVSALVGTSTKLPINITASYGKPLASNHNYTTVSTTAAAAAFVAGACALLLQEYEYSRPETLKDALLRTATSTGNDANIQGSGVIDIWDAYTFLSEQASPMPVNRTYSPPMPYAGFLPNYLITGVVNETALWFTSTYGSLNYFTYVLQNRTSVGTQHNITNLLQGMFGLYHDGQFNFLMLDKVYREMHLTHFGNYSRAVSILSEQTNANEHLLIVITAEAWQSSIALINTTLSMRLRFDIINIGNSTVNDLYLNTWMKADLGFQGNIATLGEGNTGGYLKNKDTLYVNDTSEGPDNSTFFMVKPSNSSSPSASQLPAARAVGGLSNTISWFQNNSTSSNSTMNSTTSDSVDNVTLAAKYPLATSLAPGAVVSINFSVACGFTFARTLTAVNYTLAGYKEPAIHDIVVVTENISRMYQVNDLIPTSALIINIGNRVVNATMAAFAATNVVNDSTKTYVEFWNLGNVRPLQFFTRSTIWSPTHEGVYSCSWISADRQTLMNLLFNSGSYLGANLGNINNIININPSSFSISQLSKLSGSIGSLLGGNGTEDNPLDNLLIRDVFIYSPSRMYMHVDSLPGNSNLILPRPYAGITPNTPVSASMKPEYIGQYALYNLTVYSTVPLTGLKVSVQGNASIMFVQNLNDLASVLSNPSTGVGSIPSTASTGTVITVFIDATLIEFPQAGNYVSILNFTSDQGFVDSVRINYTIQFPRGKIFFDTQHNDLTAVLTGRERHMIMGSYYQLYQAAKKDNYDIDEYIVFNDYTQMIVQGINLLNFYDAIIIAGPIKGFTPAELNILMNYYNNGGKIIVLAEPDMGSSSGSPLGGLSGNLNFNFNFTSISDLLSGAGNAPDSCNITGLSKLTSKFGFTFNKSYSTTTTVTSFNPNSPITSGINSIELSSYITFYISGNKSMNKILANDSSGNPIAAINENPRTGGELILIGDSNFVDAYRINQDNNSQFITNVFKYALRNELHVTLKGSSSEIHMGDTLFIQAALTSTYHFPGVSLDNMTGIVAYIGVKSREKILLQFFPTNNGYYTTFLASAGMNLSGYYFPPFNNTGDYYALIIFNAPGVTGFYCEYDFKILPRINETEFNPPLQSASLEGVIIFTVSMAIIIAIYFNARRKQEESMAVPDLDAKMVRNIDNLLMELQSKITMVSEDILYKRTEDYKTRLTNLETKIKSFDKAVKKIKKFKKRISRF